MAMPIRNVNKLKFKFFRLNAEFACPGINQQIANNDGIVECKVQIASCKSILIRAGIMQVLVLIL